MYTAEIAKQAFEAFNGDERWVASVNTFIIDIFQAQEELNKKIVTVARGAQKLAAEVAEVKELLLRLSAAGSSHPVAAAMAAATNGTSPVVTGGAESSVAPAIETQVQRGVASDVLGAEAQMDAAVQAAAAGAADPATTSIGVVRGKRVALTQVPPDASAEAQAHQDQVEAEMNASAGPRSI